MKKIIKITQNKKYPDLYLIHLDDEIDFYVDLETLLSHNLKKGVELEDQLIEKLLDLAIFAKTKSDVIRKLAYKNYTESEIRKFIIQKDKLHSYEQFIHKLKDQGLVNDIQFTKRFLYIASNSSKPKGKNLLSAELHRKGIPTEIINQELSNMDENEQDLQIYIRKYLSKQRSTDQRKLKEKLLRHLLSRGYSYSTIISNIDSLFA